MSQPQTMGATRKRAARTALRGGPPQGSPEAKRVAALDIGKQRQRGGKFARTDFIFRSVKLVHKFHDRGHGRVEVPAPLEIYRDALDGLVQLALNLPGLG